jgi:hypothetical protein
MVRRVVNNAVGAGFTSDGCYYIHKCHENNQDCLGAWDVHAHAPATPLKPAGWIERSPKGSDIVVVSDAGEDRWSVSLWNPNFGSQSRLGGERNQLNAWFSPDGQSILILQDRVGGPAEIWDVGTAKKRCELPIVSRNVPLFAGNGRHVILWTAVGDGTRKIVAGDLDLGKALWDRDDRGSDAIFTSDDSAVIVAESTGRLFEIVDTCSGTTRARLDPFPASHHLWRELGAGLAAGGPYLLCCSMSEKKNGVPAAPASPGPVQRFLELLLARAMRQPDVASYAVAVVDTRSGLPVFSRSAQDFCPAFGFLASTFAMLGPHGGSLLTTHRHGDVVVMKC